MPQPVASMGAKRSGEVEHDAAFDFAKELMLGAPACCEAPHGGLASLLGAISTAFSAEFAAVRWQDVTS